MIRCKVMDCLHIQRRWGECTNSVIEINSKGECISFRQDKEYLNSLLHQFIHSVQTNGYDPETQEMVSIAESLNHTPSVKALERRGD